MNIPFVKMQAQGNDFVIVDALELIQNSEQITRLAKDVCLPHFGLGADGLVILDSQIPQMTIFNSDGSMAEMCGSALRCCCALLYTKNGKNEYEIKTGNGILKGFVDKINPEIVSVEIGNPVMISQDLTVEGVKGDYISVGNPHFVVFTNNVNSNPHQRLGQVISGKDVFVNGVNVEFARIISKREIELVVWERGVGATLACGTGATATVFSGQNRNLLGDEVLVHLPGGDVIIKKNPTGYILKGETAVVAEGVFKWKV